MVKKILAFSMVAAMLVFSGCSTKGTLTPTEMKIQKVPQQFDEMGMELNISKGARFSSILKKIESDLHGSVVIINKLDKDIIFDRNLTNVTMNDIKSFVKLTKNRTIVFRKFGTKIVTVEEEKRSSLKKTTNPVQVPSSNMKINFKGAEFTYKEIFNILRKKGFQVRFEKFLKDSKFDDTHTIKDFSGTLKDLFDLIAAREKVFISSKGKKIMISDVKAKIYDLELPILDLEPSAISTGDVKAKSDKFTQKMKPLEDLESTLKMAFGSKTKYNINKSDGTLTIIGDYKTIQIADQIVEDFKERYSKTIKIHLAVYQVELSRDHAFGIDYNFIKNELLGNRIVQAISVSPGLTKGFVIDGGTISVSKNSKGIVASTSSVQNNGGNADNQEGNQQDGENQNPAPPQPQTPVSEPEKINSFIFKFLNRFGKTSILTKPTLTTINNVPIRLNIIDSKDYIYRVNQTVNTVSNTNNVYTTGGITPEIKTLTTGFSLIVQPKIAGKYIKLLMRMNTATNNGFDVYEYGDAKNKFKIQLRNLSSRSFEEILKMKENETAVIGGYIYEKGGYQKNALPMVGEKDSALDPFFSGKEKSRKKMEIVLVITVKVV